MKKDDWIYFLYFCDRKSIDKTSRIILNFQTIGCNPDRYKNRIRMRKNQSLNDIVNFAPSLTLLSTLILPAKLVMWL